MLGGYWSLMFTNIRCSPEQTCAEEVAEISPLIIPEGIDGACTAVEVNGVDTIQLNQRQRCRLQCMIGYAQSETPYQECQPVRIRTTPNGDSKLDLAFCTGAADTLLPGSSSSANHYD